MGNRSQNNKLPFTLALLAAVIVIVAIFLFDRKTDLQYALPVEHFENLKPNTKVLYEGENVGTVLTLNTEKQEAIISFKSSVRDRLPMPDYLKASLNESATPPTVVLVRLSAPVGNPTVDTQVILETAESVINTSIDQFTYAKDWFKTGTGNELRLKTQQYLKDLEHQADSKSAEVRQQVFVKLAEGDQLVQEIKTRYDQEYALEVEQNLKAIREKAEAVAGEAKESVQGLTDPAPYKKP